MPPAGLEDHRQHCGHSQATTFQQQQHHHHLHAQLSPAPPPLASPGLQGLLPSMLGAEITVGGGAPPELLSIAHQLALGAPQFL